MDVGTNSDNSVSVRPETPPKCVSWNHPRVPLLNPHHQRGSFLKPPIKEGSSWNHLREGFHLWKHPPGGFNLWHHTQKNFTSESTPREGFIFQTTSQEGFHFWNHPWRVLFLKLMGHFTIIVAIQKYSSMQVRDGHQSKIGQQEYISVSQNIPGEGFTWKHLLGWVSLLKPPLGRMSPCNYPRDCFTCKTIPQGMFHFETIIRV